MTIGGGCHCGAFRFEIEGPLGEVRLCHCDDCRKINGTAYSANCRVPVERYRIIADRGEITVYRSSRGAVRAFCATCGSPLYAKADRDPGGIRVRLGTLDRDVQAKVTAHVWTGSNAAWDIICDDLPRYLEGADGPLDER